MAQSNLDQLTQAGCIPKDAQLSDAELAVIDGLSNKEINTLIDIRNRLQKASASGGATAFTDLGDIEGTITPNIIV